MPALARMNGVSCSRRLRRRVAGNLVPAWRKNGVRSTYVQAALIRTTRAPPSRRTPTTKHPPLLHLSQRRDGPRTTMTTYSNMNGLQRATLPRSRSKQLLRSTIHLLSYHFILRRRRTTVARVAGFRLTVRPTVFHPRYFLAMLFIQARERLASGGCMYVLFSSDSDLDLLGSLISRAGFTARLVAKRSILIESLIIYELTLRR
jgi:hypothetical protein